MRPAELTPQTLLQHRYRILQTLGNGGMGRVYKAEDMRLNRDCALKQAFFSSDTLRGAFKTEAILLARLRHDSLPIIYDHFSDENGAFLVMEFIPGLDLAEMLDRRGAFPHNLVFEWANQLLGVLDYLHTLTSPIIHRDIKPNNLKLNSKDAIVLLDFGLAKDMGDGTLVPAASKHFSSLEQRIHSKTDARSDIYALGATLYNLVTGKLPPDALDERYSNIRNGLPDPLQSVRDVNPQVSRSLANVIDRALALDQQDRPTSAAELLETLNIEQSTLSLSDGTKITPLAPPQLPATLDSKPRRLRFVAIKTFIVLAVFAAAGALLATLLAYLTVSYILNLNSLLVMLAACEGALSAVLVLLIVESFGLESYWKPENELIFLSQFIAFITFLCVAAFSLTTSFVAGFDLAIWQHLLIWGPCGALSAAGSLGLIWLVYEL